MASISITINKELRITINLEDDYTPEKFIETFEGYIKQVRTVSGIPEPVKDEVNANQDKFTDANELFKKLSSLIEKLGKDIRKVDNKTMRSFKFDRPLRSKVIAMLSPKGQPLVVYLRKGDHSSVDPDKKIVYENTFGGYPMLYIRKIGEVDYVFDIIKKIYVTP